MNVMDVKLDNFCCCVETRIGCIIIGVVGAVIAIITVVCNGGIPEYLGIPVTLLGCGCLIYAAARTSDNAERRITAVLVYLVTLVFRGILNFIGTILTCLAWDHLSDSNNRAYGVYGYQMGTAINDMFAFAVMERMICIFLDIYFSLVAFSFYQQLKEENAKEDIKEKEEDAEEPA